MLLSIREIGNKLNQALKKYPRIKNLSKKWARIIFPQNFPAYPKAMGNEINNLKRVLTSSQWNMGYGPGLVHEELEREFAAYLGVRFAVAVNTGGMAIQIALRGLGIKPGDEIIHQVDTCVADAFAVINAGGTPIFSDISSENLMLNKEDLRSKISGKTKVIMPVHMWGYPEDMDIVNKVASEKSLIVLEDCALALGAEWKKRKVGTLGSVGVFSFGCMKPIQAGEGGMIVTDDQNLAKEFKTIRAWGEMTEEFGTRDQKQLSWNGRMSEFVAAVALAQLRGYNEHLKRLNEGVEVFLRFLEKFDGFQIPNQIRNGYLPAFSQVTVKIDPNVIGTSKRNLMETLSGNGIPMWHANFEPITSLSFFKNGYWKDWILKGALDAVEDNYKQPFKNSEEIYSLYGLGFKKVNFLTKTSVKFVCRSLDRLLSKKGNRIIN
jgi:dTDP-4-amino-4,6-dideoxygalactose transaminase